MDQAAELYELRRLAFSRTGTEDDRRRLALLEASIQAEASTPAAQPHEATGEPDDEGEAPDEAVAADLEPPRRLRWRAAGIGAAVGALLATSVTLVVVAASTPEPVPIVASALAVFEREPRAVDDPAALWFSIHEFARNSSGPTPVEVEDLTLRWVGAASGNDVYAIRWHDGDEYTICLTVVSPTEAGSACSSETDFVANGIRMSANGVEVKWGPSGAEVWVNSFST